MKLYKQGKFLKIKNRSESYENRYKIRYSCFGIKLTVKNKKKIDFYLNKKNELKIKTYEEKYKSIIEELNSKRKNKNPILTVLLLTYNHVDTIEKCIQSLLDQDTKYEYIIKILDDASIDGTTDICFEYAQKYPEKIEYVLQPINTRGKHFANAIKNITTPYWCYIDGDDWWLTENKIEKALNFLENNKDFSIYMSNFYYQTSRKQYDYLNDLEKYSIEKRGQVINPSNYVYAHPSTRIHRNVIDYSKEFKGMKIADIYLYFTSLTKGNAFIDTEFTGIWNHLGNGIWSSLSEESQIFSACMYWYSLNKHTNFKYNCEISSYLKNSQLITYQKYLGKSFGWKCYLKNRKNFYKNREIERINKKYQSIVNRYTKKY